jgi:flavin-dependent dehydrogenase
VKDVAFDATGADVTAVLDDGAERRWRAKFVLDCSGRDTFLSHKFKAKQRNPDHNSSALFGHFRNARRLEGKKEGNISICWFEHGWFWFIPLADGTTSIGAVCWPYYLKSRSKPLKEFFMDTIALAPKLAERLKDAQLVDDLVHATGNYSYDGTHCSGERYLMLGDAFAFVDPVFSSGVYLAMHSAFESVEVVNACLGGSAAESARTRAKFEKDMRRGPREFSWFIFRVTNPTMREFFMYPQNPLRVKEALLSLLAGDIYGKTPIWGSLRVLKGLYYMVSLMNFKRTWHAWRQRQLNIRELGPLQGETVMAEGGR